MNNDQIFKEGARASDEDLAGRVSTAGADALLAEIILLEHIPARRLMPSPGRALLGLAAAAVLAGAIVVGPSLFRTSEQVYASQAVTIDRVGDEYVFYFTEGEPERAELEDAFRKIGLDNLTVKLIPVSPHDVGNHLGVKKTDPDARAKLTDTCPERIANCVAAFSITADIEGPAEVTLTRPANPGEKYGNPADASSPGEALAGVKLQGRSVAEVARVVREHDLKVAYSLGWPHRNGDNKVVRFEYDVPASRIDPSWMVTSAETYNDGVIVLHVTPGPAATPPPGF
ncbi:hypothetical protein [Nonomuraea sp. KM90]|uniref:hypothetical protein n=1 Tax=Nonomuraea sp. KM90 TaxID=3457428 RepID=UPI003FCD536C